MRSTIAFFAPLLSVLAVSPLRADPVNWSATSDTAMAISGDIVVDDYTLTFANGKSLAIEPYEAGGVGDWSRSGKSVAGDVFTADSSANLKLLNGNKLCATPVTYVVIWSPGEGELGINVYSGSKAPTGTGGLCASYSIKLPSQALPLGPVHESQS